ncbi:acyl-CoA-like ligand-binding transcription factor [Modestobacter sp. SYSU DS0290]
MTRRRSRLVDVGDRAAHPAGATGRPAVTTPHELAAVAQRLFVTAGFEGTSIDDIARAAGIGRRTFFRYFESKADVLFVESPAELARLRQGLAAAHPGEPRPAVVTRAVLAALHHPPEDREWALQRAQLILGVPALAAHTSVVLSRWCRAVADHARTRPCADPYYAEALGHAVVAATVAAHAHWIAHPETELADALLGMLRLLLPAEPAGR